MPVSNVASDWPRTFLHPRCFCLAFIYPIYSALYLCVGTLYRYEICCGDSVRLTLQYKMKKLHMHSSMRATKLNKVCMNFCNLWLTVTLTDSQEKIFACSILTVGCANKINFVFCRHNHICIRNFSMYKTSY